MNLNYFQDQFDMVNECKDPEVKKIQLEVLANNMEQTYNIPAGSNEDYVKQNPYVMKLYNIPADSNEDYAQQNPYVMKLYKKVKGAIWIIKKFNM